ncbi:PAS domain-containing protein [Temperatibacter marinus]|uniref:PAS domain-containing protein n=1 Tax=Temperatibacter marinus TaxID=1456591 RepID=A0AA52EG74_9PROT|nr:PAS domain-containing protein [Temperatibacter marinus]WND01939.1 PAS domain-containing protein [Temperatibacter marinus]
MQIGEIASEYLNFWHSLPKNKDGLPTKSSFKLQRIPESIPHLLILDVYQDEAFYHANILFAGSAKCALFKAEMNGLNLLFLFDKNTKKQIYKDLKDVITTPSVYYLKSLTPYERGISTLDEVVAVPIYDEVEDKRLVYMLSHGEPASDFDPIDLVNARAKIIIKDHWLDIGHGIPKNKPALIIDDV